MLTDVANIIFQYAKRRCYAMSTAVKAKAQVVNLVDDEDERAILDQMETEAAGRPVPSGGAKKWLPEGMEPVLEELPKWSLLGDVLQEIEEEMMRREPHLGARVFIPFFSSMMSWS